MAYPEIFAKLPNIYRLGTKTGGDVGTATTVSKQPADLVISSLLHLTRPIGNLAVKAPILDIGLPDEQRKMNALETRNGAKIQKMLQGIQGVPLYYGSSRDTHYSEWIEGKKTSDVRGGFMLLPDVITFLKFAGRVVSDAFKRGVVVRDIVPRNIINSDPDALSLNQDNLHLIDFGKSYVIKKHKKNDYGAEFEEKYSQNDVAPAIFSGLQVEVIIGKQMVEAIGRLLPELFPPDKLHEIYPEEARKYYNSLGILLTTLEPEELEKLPFDDKAKDILRLCLMKNIYLGQEVDKLIQVMRKSCGRRINFDNHKVEEDPGRTMTIQQFIEATKSL